VTYRIALLLVCAGAGLLVPAGATHAQVVEPTQAQFLLSNTPTPPPAASPGWQTRSIPDEWARTQPGQGGIGWYRFTFSVDDPAAEPWAVLINHRATVYVNGTAVGGAQDLYSTSPGPFLPPVLFVIDPKVLRAGENEVLIGMHALPDVQIGGLNSARVGPKRLLRLRYEIYYFLKVTFCQASVVLNFTLAALFGALWLRRREDSIYGWFALACTAWATRPWLLLIRDPQLDHWAWDWLVLVQLAWMYTLSLMLTRRFFKLERPWVESVALAYSVGVVLVFPVYPQLDRMMLLLPATFANYYFMWILVRGAWRTRNQEENVFAIGAAALVLTTIADTLWVTHAVPRTTWQAGHFGTLVLSVSLAWILISRFAQALRAAENTGVELARQVERKRHELDASYRSVQELRQREAVINERERIMRDLHDGLGGQLVSALALSQGAEASKAAVTQTLREALDDLRMVIDSLEPAGDLLALLGTLRGRLEPRLLQQGLRFDWQVEDIPAMPDFGPDKALQVLRIVQEAIANVLRHSGARTVTVRTGTEAQPPAVFVQIADDGSGFAEARAGGRGLQNMRQRATRIGGQLDVASGDNGTIVRLSLPLASAA
jgi:signal transduction histidine kinase